MTIKDYITDKVKALRFNLSTSDLSDINKAVSLVAEDTDENIKKALLVLATKIIPFYYANVPTSISESGFSMSWKNDMSNFYRWLCKELDIEDNLSDNVSKISDASNIW